MSSLGKEIRMARLLNPASGNILVVAMDHAIAHGVLPGIERIQEAMDKVVRGRPEAITIHKGIAEKCFSRYAGRVALILKCSSFAPYHPTYDAWVAEVDEAVKLGADAISIGVTLGGKDQVELLENLGLLAREAELMGMPLISHIYPKGEMIKKEEMYSAENVVYAARTAAELGVDIVKTFYTGSPDTFRKVVEACPARVVVAGGPKLETVRKVLEMTKGAMEAGAIGVTYGRNVWQYEDPTTLIRALRSIIHKGQSVDEVLQWLKGQGRG